MKYLLSTAIALAVTSMAVAAPQDGAAPKKATPAPKAAAAAKAPKVGDKIKCAVMGEEFTLKANSLKSEYKGKTYYFCCEGCKPSFDKNPTKYVKAEPAPKKAAPAKAAPKKPA
jgi:YHS domain-containing protein